MYSHARGVLLYWSSEIAGQENEGSNKSKTDQQDWRMKYKHLTVEKRETGKGDIEKCRIGKCADEIEIYFV